MNTFNLKHIALAVCASLALAACGGGDEPDPTPVPEPTPATQGKFITQTCDMPAQASEQTVTLRGLTSAVTRQTGTVDWLTAQLLPYSSGTPQVLLRTTENLGTTARQFQLVFIASRDTLALSVRQAAYSATGGTDVSTPTDTPTDQPAYMPRK